MFAIAVLSFVLVVSWSSGGEARLIGLGGGALIDWTGALGLSFPMMLLVRLSVGLFFLGANLGMGLISIFGELGLFAYWEMPIVWQGPLVGLGMQLGF